MAEADDEQLRTTIKLVRRQYPDLYAAMEDISDRQRSERYRSLADKGLLAERHQMGAGIKDYIEWRINSSMPDRLARFLKQLPFEERVTRLWQLALTGLFMEEGGWNGQVASLPTTESIMNPVDEDELAAMGDIAGAFERPGI